MGYVFITHNYHSYTMDFLSFRLSFSPISFLASLCCSLWSIELFLVRVAQPLLAMTCITAIRSTSVSYTDRPPRRGLPLPKYHNHWLTSQTLLPFLPDSLARSAQQYGNLLRCRLWKQCGIVGLEFPENKGIKGTCPSTFETGPTQRMGDGEGQYNFTT